MDAKVQKVCPCYLFFSEKSLPELVREGFVAFSSRVQMTIENSFFFMPAQKESRKGPGIQLAQVIRMTSQDFTIGQSNILPHKKLCRRWKDER
jgi:hypothetical protein